MVKCCRYVSVASPWTTRFTGIVGTPSWRLFFYAGSKKISPWYDIPLKKTQPAKPAFPTLHFISEMPKGSTAKMEIATDERYHPIRQDQKNGVLRVIKAGPMPFNYGCLPQTLEDPEMPDAIVGLVGDGDPLDVVELSEEPIGTGSVQPVKVLGALPLVDQGNIDWKLITIQLNHYMAKQVSDLSDVARVWPGRLPAIKEWFATYKMAEGGAMNRYAMANLDRDAAYELVDGAHESWKRKMTKETDTTRVLPRATRLSARPYHGVTHVSPHGLVVSKGKTR